MKVGYVEESEMGTPSDFELMCRCPSCGDGQFMLGVVRGRKGMRVLVRRCVRCLWTAEVAAPAGTREREAAKRWARQTPQWDEPGSGFVAAYTLVSVSEFQVPSPESEVIDVSAMTPEERWKEWGGVL